MSNNSGHGQAVGRALRILELLAPERDGLRVTDIANALQLNKAIVFRILSELVRNRYVAQDPNSQRYVATFTLAAVGLQKLESGNLNEWAQEPLDRLAARTKELVRLAVAEGSSLHWIAKAQGANSGLMVDAAAGKGVQLHATATGKAWLSTLDNDHVRDIISRVGLPAQTPNTITDIETLLADLETVRQHGFATTTEEMDPGITAVAAPIVRGGGHAGAAVGTVSVAGPAARLGPEMLEHFAPDVIATASELATRWSIYEQGPNFVVQ